MSTRTWFTLLALSFAACGGNRNTPNADGGPRDMSDPFGALDLVGEPPPDFSKYRDRDAACAMASATGKPAKKPVDLIVVIDNSGSMSKKIRGVELNINNNLGDLLNKSGIDYRVIFITSFGDWTNNMICPAPPLSGNNCTAPVKGPPMNRERYFHYDYNIQSTDSFSRVIESYKKPDPWGLAPNGWSGYLRKEALKMFIEITDDTSAMTGAQFDFMLRVLDPVQFGTDRKRNYIFHSIIGLKANNPVTKPWAPSDPIQNLKCGVDAENAGEEYQALSILTGGLRFPICEWANFNGIFQEITKGVEDGTRLACEIVMPAPPGKEEIDPDSLLVEYTPSFPIGAAPKTYLKVPDVNQCAASRFYVNPVSNSIVLCPEACAEVQKDTMAKLRVIFDCLGIVPVRGGPISTAR